MSPAHELALHLQAQGVGTFAGSGDWSIHVAREPLDPANTVTIYDTGGPAPVHYGVGLRQPTVQVRVRAESYIAGMGKQGEIFAWLNAIQDATIGTHVYLGVHLTTDFLAIGRDDNERHLITANYQIQRGVPA